jgi:predicted transcriptional regulator of viral defense system
VAYSKRLGAAFTDYLAIKAPSMKAWPRVATKVPQAVFCLLTALQFHELTTQLPREVWIAMPRGSHTPKIDYPPVKMVQFAGEAYSEGVEIVERDQVKLRMSTVLPRPSPTASSTATRSDSMSRWRR